jgi:TatA/E family protein of Tat protein translocase
MHTPLLVFEFLGTTELLVIAVVALILFGPRKLPEIGRTVGRGIAEFKRASDDFKRTWEYEVEIEQRKPAAEVNAPAAHDADSVDTSATALPAYDAGAGDFDGHAAEDPAPEPTVARGASGDDEHAWDVATGRALKRDVDDEVNAS